KPETGNSVGLVHDSRGPGLRLLVFEVFVAGNRSDRRYAEGSRIEVFGAVNAELLERRRAIRGPHLRVIALLIKACIAGIVYAATGRRGPGEKFGNGRGSNRARIDAPELQAVQESGEPR